MSDEGDDDDDDDDDDESVDEDNEEDEYEDDDVIYGCPSRPRTDDDGLFSYTLNEMNLLKQVDIYFPSVPNAKDISRADKAVCNYAFISWEGQNESENLQIHKGMMFDTLQELQFFMADYAVKFHKLFYVVHSDKNCA